MKFKTARQDLQRCISAVMHLAYNKPQRSILECILMRAQDGVVTLDVCDTVNAMQMKLYADVEEEGVCAVTSKLLASVVSKLADGEVTIEKNEENGITLSCSNTCIKLQEMDAAQFPAFPQVKGKQFEIEARTLSALVEGTAFSVYTQPDKPVFTGLLFESDGTHLNVVGIDGVRMAKRTAHIEGEPARVIIPAKAMREVSRLAEEDQTITLYMDRSACFFVAEEYQIYTRLLEGEFMNYNNIIPKSFKTMVTVNRALLESSINMVSVMTHDVVTNPIRLHIEFDSIRLSAKSEFGSASDVVPAKLRGETVSFALNAKYMQDVLRAIEDEEIVIEMDNSLKPCVIRPVEDDQYLYLIVPLNMKD